MKKHIFIFFIIMTFLVFPAVSFSAAGDAMSECDKADQDMQDFKPPQKPWSVNVAVGTQYDSNVILTPDNVTLPKDISKRADWREVADVKAGYNIIKNDKVMLSVGYNVYQSFQNRLSDFNVTNQKFDTTGLVSVMPFMKVGLKYYFEYVLLGGDNYNSAHNVAPAMIVSPVKKFPTMIEYRYKDNSFKDTKQFDNNSERTGSNKLVGITQSIPILPTLKTFLSYSQDEDNTRQDFLNYKGKKTKFEVHYDLPMEIQMTFKGELYNRKFTGLDPDSGKKRKDNFYSADIVFSKKIYKKLGITLNLGHFFSKNNSNTNSFDYKRSITSVFINRGF